MADTDLPNCDGSSNVVEMLKTMNDLKFNIEISNWIGLKKTIKRLDRFLLDTKNSRDVLNIYLEGLVTLEKFLSDVLPDNYKKRKVPEMTVTDIWMIKAQQHVMEINDFSTKNVLALFSLKKKVIKRYKKYQDLITSQFRDINPTVYEVDLNLSDKCCYNGDKAEAETSDKCCYNGDKAEEEALELEKYLYKAKERLERHTQAKLAQMPAQKLSSVMRICTSRLVAKSLSIKRLMKCVQNLLIVLDILTQYPNIVLTNEIDLFSIRKCETMKGAGCEGRIRVHGDLLALVMHICVKFTKFLKSSKPDDVERLKGETIMLVALRNVMDYFRKTYDCSEAAKGGRDYLQKEGNFSEAAKVLDYSQSDNNFGEAALDVEDFFIRKNNLSKAATVALSLIRRVYDKSQDLYETMLNLVDQIPFSANNANEDDEEHLLPSTSLTSLIVSRRPRFPEKCETLMTELVNFATLHGNEDIKSHAVLYQVYHLAVMDDFSKACDLLRSYMQNGVQKMNSQTQLHFNRAVAQLGLCAYRAGLIEEAHGFLSELLCAHEGVEELLLQDTIGEKAAPVAAMVVREYPYHKPIDLEHLKSVHIKCCALLEDPHIVNTTTRRNKVHFVSCRIRTPVGSEGRPICGASWERVCDGRFCCAAYSMNNSNNNDNNNNKNDTVDKDTVKKLMFTKWIESRGLQPL